MFHVCKIMSHVKIPENSKEIIFCSHQEQRGEAFMSSGVKGVVEEFKGSRKGIDLKRKFYFSSTRYDCRDDFFQLCFSAFLQFQVNSPAPFQKA